MSVPLRHWLDPRHAPVATAWAGTVTGPHTACKSIVAGTTRYLLILSDSLPSLHRVCKSWVPCHSVKNLDENRQRTLHIPYMINWNMVCSCVCPLHTSLCPGCSGNTFEQMNKLSSASFSLLSLKYLYLKLVMRLPQEKSFPQKWHQNVRVQGHAYTPPVCHVKMGCWVS